MNGLRFKARWEEEFRHYLTISKSCEGSSINNFSFVKKAAWSPFYGNFLGATEEVWTTNGQVSYQMSIYSMNQIIQNSQEIYEWPIYTSISEFNPITDF